LVFAGSSPASRPDAPAGGSSASEGDASAAAASPSSALRDLAAWRSSFRLVSWRMASSMSPHFSRMWDTS
jgi:hypothetical protein